jgi:hypothetical protein
MGLGGATLSCKGYRSDFQTSMFIFQGIIIAGSKIIGKLQIFSHMEGIEWVSRPCMPSFPQIIETNLETKKEISVITLSNLS